MKQKKKQAFETLLMHGDVSLYGYRGDAAEFLARKKEGKVRVFLKKGALCPAGIPDSIVRSYQSVLDIGWEPGDICVLDGESIKGLALGFPSASPFVLVGIRPSFVWMFGVPGLLRRVAMGQVRLGGFVKIAGRQWLLLERRGERWGNPMFLSCNIGIRGLLEFLSQKNIRYVVPRFFERLPYLHREGGDLDLLVADEDEAKVREFINENSGTIRVDVWNVSSPAHHGLPYFLPRVARDILESAIDGPGGSRIPAPREAFLALAYHALYHKGPEAGVPSATSGVVIRQSPESDYGVILARMASDAGFPFFSNMESLDDILESAGWRPRIDTLAKIAERNEWVRERFFSNEKEGQSAIAVFVIREEAFRLGVVEKIREVIRMAGFIIVREKRLCGEDQKRAADQLRGGTWREGLHAEGDHLLPALVLVLRDPYALRKEDPDLRGGRFKTLKDGLRRAFDRKHVSLVHSTDNTAEAREYVGVCFAKEEVVAVLQEAERPQDPLSFAQRLRVLPYRLRAGVAKAKNKIVRFLAQ